MSIGLIPARAGSTPGLCMARPWSRAHPRLCGEHSLTPVSVMPLWGSSPPVRGARCGFAVVIIPRGLIPARAGNTRQLSLHVCIMRAHPRSRGEHHALLPTTSIDQGSSPLARGTRFAQTPDSRRAGLIPARAGNTEVLDVSGAVEGAHPRSRGEHSPFGFANVTCWGSSPLARGTPTRKFSRFCSPGLIPARAGNTRFDKRADFATWAHPRSRGEHCSLCGVCCGMRGSSPLARGTRFDGSQKVERRGLIPARAGNTSVARYRAAVSGAHPRSRGEHVRMLSRVLRRLGSSPLARGTPNLGRHILKARGLIPARAGNTCRPRPSAERGRAHPRSRGEHYPPGNRAGVDGGSSPLARGTRRSIPSLATICGLIPARAGNT